MVLPTANPDKKAASRLEGLQAARKVRGNAPNQTGRSGEVDLRPRVLQLALKFPYIIKLPLILDTTGKHNLQHEHCILTMPRLHILIIDTWK